MKINVKVVTLVVTDNREESEPLKFRFTGRTARLDALRKAEDYGIRYVKFIETIEWLYDNRR